MRRFLVATAVILFAAASAQAVTITVQLRDLTGGTAQGNHVIGIYLQSDGSSSADDLGISGAQMDVIAQDTNSNYTGTFSAVGSNWGTYGYSHINPAKVDGTTANSSVSSKPGPETVLNNGNLDAMGFSISVTPGNVDPVNVGGVSNNGALEFVGKETWNFSATSTLKAFLVGPQYFDSADSGQTSDTFHNYDTVVQTSATGAGLTVTIVPEPATLVLLGLGGLGMIVAARRRAA